MCIRDSHEPTRKFFPNELMRVPLYEVVPLDLIMGHCFVLDVNTFCKGRPVGADPQHIYICEYRVDKSARLFAKLARAKVPPVCTKSYAFEKYDTRLKITRTYTVRYTFISTCFRIKLLKYRLHVCYSYK